jgi:antitoxin (DNA-binding transcriptional repressor) of toxin-antitoxin stability system
VTEQILVPFRGDGCGVGELAWGQRELWGGMVQQRRWFPIGGTFPARPGTTLAGVAADLGFLVGRHQTMRTRLRFGPNRWPLQVVAHSGEVPLEVVEAGDEDPAAVAARVEQLYRETDYDFEREWPVRWGLIQRHGRPTHRVAIMCHLVTDGFGVSVLGADLANRDRPVAELQPLAQARWQRSPAGQRQNQQALRYWERLLRNIPAQRFRTTGERARPRYWKATLDSPAMFLAAHTVATRTGADTSTVLLASFLIARARITGINPSVTRVLVSNRFRPGLADVVAPVSQPGLCVVDVADATVDEVVARTRRQAVPAYKHAYYDTFELNRLIDRVGEERGERLDIACFFNDRRLPGLREPAGPVPTRHQLRAALARTSFGWAAKQDHPTERFFLHIEDVPDTIGISVWADTHHTSPADLEGFLLTMESALVDAASDPAAATAGVGR